MAHRRWSFAHAALLGVLVLTGAPLVGCVSNDTSTQLTVALTSEAAIPKEISVLNVTVSSGGSTPLDETYDLTRDSNGYFPQTLALIPKDSESLNNPVTVTVTASDASNTAVVARAVTASYVEGRTLLLPVALRMACFGAVNSCGAEQTCVGGQCVATSVPTSALVDYEPKYVFEEPGSCFDMQTCVGSAEPVSVPVESIASGGNVKDCTFPLPEATGTSDVPNVNVAIEWKVARGRIIVLEGNDPAEGWTVSRTDPTKGVLSQGVCNAVKADPNSPGFAQLPSTVATAGVLYVSTKCPAKSALRPSCESTQDIGVACPGGTCGH